MSAGVVVIDRYPFAPNSGPSNRISPLLDAQEHHKRIVEKYVRAAERFEATWVAMGGARFRTAGDARLALEQGASGSSPLRTAAAALQKALSRLQKSQKQPRTSPNWSPSRPTSASGSPGPLGESTQFEPPTPSLESR